MGRQPEARSYSRSRRTRFAETGKRRQTESCSSSRFRRNELPTRSTCFAEAGKRRQLEPVSASGPAGTGVDGTICPKRILPATEILAGALHSPRGLENQENLLWLDNDPVESHRRYRPRDLSRFP